MLARYYSYQLGRFLAVDPDSSSAMPVMPQSWNRYAYAGNNPLRNVDPNGQDFVDFVNGVANGFGSSMMAGGGRLQGQNADYQAGQTVGDAAAVVGAIEAVVGGGLVLGEMDQQDLARHSGRVVEDEPLEEGCAGSARFSRLVWPKWTREI